MSCQIIATFYALDNIVCPVYKIYHLISYHEKSNCIILCWYVHSLDFCPKCAHWPWTLGSSSCLLDRKSGQMYPLQNNRHVIENSPRGLKRFLWIYQHSCSSVYISFQKFPTNFTECYRNTWNGLKFFQSTQLLVAMNQCIRDWSSQAEKKTIKRIETI